MKGLVYHSFDNSQQSQFSVSLGDIYLSLVGEGQLDDLPREQVNLYLRSMPIFILHSTFSSRRLADFSTFFYYNSEFEEILPVEACSYFMSFQRRGLSHSLSLRTLNFIVLFPVQPKIFWQNVQLTLIKVNNSNIFFCNYLLLSPCLTEDWKNLTGMA